MTSCWRRAALYLLAGFLLQPAFTLADEDKDKSRILFLHLRVEQDGSIRVLKSKAVPGKLKTRSQARGTFKLELQTADNRAVWSAAVEDPRVRHFEIENPPGSGKLERRTHTMAEAEFMVRVPLRGGEEKLLVFEDDPLKVKGVDRAQRKVLLTHPLPAPEQSP